MRGLLAAVTAAGALILSGVTPTLGAQLAYRTGTNAHIAPSYQADLDNGIFNGTAYDDLYFGAESKMKRFISAEGTASILRMSSKPGYNKCSMAALGDNRYNTGYNVGRWFCVKTQEARFARFKIVSSKAGDDLVINYTVWCKESDGCHAA